MSILRYHWHIIQFIHLKCKFDELWHMYAPMKTATTIKIITMPILSKRFLASLCLTPSWTCHCLCSKSGKPCKLFKRNRVHSWHEASPSQNKEQGLPYKWASGFLRTVGNQCICKCLSDGQSWVGIQIPRMSWSRRKLLQWWTCCVQGATRVISTCAHECTHTHAHTHTYTQTHTCPQPNKHTWTWTHTDTHTRKHTCT